MSASQDKVQGILETVLEESLPLIHKGIFTADELQSWMCEREKMENNMLKPTFKLSDYLKAIEFEYNLERVRRSRVQSLSATNPLFKKQSKTDFIIIKRIIKLWDRTMHKFKYNVDLWKQYLDFCIKTKSKNQFYKALSNALRFLPFCEDLWLIGVYYEVEVGLNLWKARKIFIKALRSNSTKMNLWLEMFKFQIKFLKVLYEREQAIEGEAIINFVVHSDPNDMEEEKEVQEETKKLTKVKLQEHDDILLLIYEEAMSKVVEGNRKEFKDSIIAILTHSIKEEKIKNVVMILKRALKRVEENEVKGLETSLMKKEWTNTVEAPKTSSIEEKVEYYEQFLSENSHLSTSDLDKIICQFLTKPVYLTKLLSSMFDRSPELYLKYLMETKKFKAYNLPAQAINIVLSVLEDKIEAKPYQDWFKVILSNLNPNKYIECLELMRTVIKLNKKTKNYKANNDLHRSVSVLCQKQPEIMERCATWIHAKDQQ